MELKELEADGRALAVIFTCGRCKKTETVKMKDCISEQYSPYLRQLNLPSGWKESWSNSKILCPECSEAYKQFMSNTVSVHDVVERCEQIMCSHCNEWCDEEPCEPDDCAYIQDIRSILS